MRDGAGVIAVVVGIAVALAALWVSKNTGADFFVALTACGQSAVILVITGGIAWYNSWKPSTYIAVALVFVYPAWWPVLDSIANNTFQYAIASPWWASTWFKVLSELALIGGALYVIFGRDYG